MASPLLSVTVTNYNYGRFISRAIESILSQSFRDFELIIIDNASTDDSVDMIRSYSRSDDRIRVIEHQSNLGIMASLRESCDLACGKYRVHIDADDWVLSPHAFERQIQVLEAHPSMSFTYSAMTMIGEDGSVHHVSHPYSADCVVVGERALEPILGFNVTHSGMMLRLDAYHASGGYSPNFVMCLDVELAVRLCERGDVGYMDESLYAFGRHDCNDSLAFRPHAVRDEILPTIAVAFDGPLGARLPDRDAIRRRVVRRALVHGPTQDIFSGRIRDGLRMYWESARVSPFETVFQGRTLSLMARVLTGRRGHSLLSLGFGRLRKRSSLRSERASAQLEKYREHNG